MKLVYVGILSLIKTSTAIVSKIFNPNKNMTTISSKEKYNSINLNKNQNGFTAYIGTTILGSTVGAIVES
jgi:hypothetical protein